MIESMKEDTLFELLPDIHEVNEFLDPKEYKNCNLGDILYNPETKEMKQYGILELIDDENEIKDTYKELVSLHDKDGNILSNEVFIEEIRKIKNEMKNIANTAETNNLPKYANKLRDMISSGKYSFVEVNKMQHKIESIESSLTLSYLREMRGRVYKFDNKLYKKYKLEANKKLKDNTKYTFPPINDILIILNNININNEKENKLFLTNFYKYIVDNKMDDVGLTIYFTLINILGLVKENNEFRQNIIHNLYSIIKYFN